MVAKVSLAQKDFQDTTWFDKDWKVSIKSNAKFYRVYKKTKSGYIVKDMYINGIPQMIAEASVIVPDIVQDGLTTYYTQSNKISSQGRFKNNKAIGRWVEYIQEGKDSTVWVIHEDGHKEYIRLISKNNNEVYTVVEEMPEFPTGMNGMLEFIQTNIFYPKEANEKNWEGKSYIKFTVDIEGNITNIAVTKSAGYSILDEEAIRVVKAMPKWKPGRQNNKAVPVLINIPFNFTLPKKK